MATQPSIWNGVILSLIKTDIDSPTRGLIYEIYNIKP